MSSLLPQLKIKSLGVITNVPLALQFDVLPHPGYAHPMKICNRDNKIPRTGTGALKEVWQFQHVFHFWNIPSLKLPNCFVSREFFSFVSVKYR